VPGADQGTLVALRTAPGRCCRVVTIKGTSHRSLPRNAESLDAMARFATGLQAKRFRSIVNSPATMRANAR